jgi:hypothetical protein
MSKLVGLCLLPVFWIGSVLSAKASISASGVVRVLFQFGLAIKESVFAT